MDNRIFDKVSDCILDGVDISPYLHRQIEAVEGDRPLLSESPWRHGRDNVRSNLIQIHGAGYVQGNGVKSGDAQELLDKPVHTHAHRT